MATPNGKRTRAVQPKKKPKITVSHKIPVSEVNEWLAQRIKETRGTNMVVINFSRRDDMLVVNGDDKVK